MLDILGKKLALLIWGNKESEVRCICSPDDQDNAASFDRFGRHCVQEVKSRLGLDCCVVVIDRPGRGLPDAVSLDQW